MKNNYINKIFKFFFNKKIRFGYLTKLGIYNNTEDEFFLKKKFQITFNRKLNLNNPQSINEKIQWLKLFNRRHEYTKLVDKIKLKDYVKQKLGENFVVPLIAEWSNPEDIDFNNLPDKFVLKCNHNSGLGMFVCKDKNKINKNNVIRQLKKGMSQNYYLSGREWPYKNVERKVFCEAFLSDSKSDKLIDYKFYCFNGIVKFLSINNILPETKESAMDFFDRDFNFLDFTWGYKHLEEHPTKPELLDDMINVSEVLSEGIPFVRVDLYCCDNQIYVGEMTFFDGSGFDPIEPKEWDYKIGSLLELPDKF